MSFKEFIKEKISYFVSHFHKKLLLLDYDGDALREINLSFDHLSDLYLEQAEQKASNNLDGVEQGINTFSLKQISKEEMKIGDEDLVGFFEALDESYDVSFNVEGQDIGDQTILKLGELYSLGRCAFTKLKLAGNHRISEVGITKLGQSLRGFPKIQEINLHGLQINEGGINRIIELVNLTGLNNVDLGLIGNGSVAYLGSALQHNHSLETISFGENRKSAWREGKKVFQSCMRRCENSKQIIAVNLYLDDIAAHYQLISELNVLCRKYRNLKIAERENEFKAASLNPNHSKYYDPNNHSLNAYKFSVKSYLNNVFGSLLDEALYFLEKERRNSLREEAIFNITHQPTSKIILEDICSADGSLIVLTKYLLAKIKDKENEH